MALHTLAIDIGKHSFHVFGIDDDGVVVSRKVSRSKLVATVDCLDPKIVAMEACGSAHHWGRLFEATGRAVRLINPYFVRPFLRGSKNDATDAEAIFEAAGRPTMRFVPVKSVECQDLQALHRIRDRLVQSRTSLINHTRGLLAASCCHKARTGSLFRRARQWPAPRFPTSPVSSSPVCRISSGTWIAG